MKPENALINAIHKHIPNVWHEKMCNPYRRGTPDVWYSGKEGDLWIEYKWHPRVPGDFIPLNLSPHQELWITERRGEGRRVWVAVGLPDKLVYLLHDTVPLHNQISYFSFNTFTRQKFAQAILDTVGERHCLTKLAGG